MKHKYVNKAVFTALIAASCSFTSSAELVLEELSLSSRDRVSRTDFRYEFDVKVRNTGANVQNIVAQVSASNASSDVSQSSLSLASLDENDTATMTGKLVLVQNRRTRFNMSDLQVSFTYDDAPALNEFERTYSPNSAYITEVYPNHFVERGMATSQEVSDKVAATYAQFFDMIDAPSPRDEGDMSDVTVFSDDFTSLSNQWNANPDNGTNPGVSLSLNNERLAVSPSWNAPGDAIALKFQQFEPADFSQGATIKYLMEAAQAYVDDGNMAMQLILEDVNFTPAFFAYRQLNTAGEIQVDVPDVGPGYEFGFIGDGFDFTQVAGIGFQFLANNKPVDVQGDIFIDDIIVTVPAALAAPNVVFEDDISAGISNWNVQNDNGTTPVVTLSDVNQTLVVSPQWFTPNDAFTVKYQQFSPIDINLPVNISVDVKIPSSYADFGNMAMQLVVEDINFQVGFTGFAFLTGRPGDEFFTLTFENIGPDSSYGFISPSFDYTQLAGFGLQVLANGKPIDVLGDIEIDNVLITQSPSNIVIPSDGNTSVLFAASDDMAFIKEINTGYVLSEGMSYGMMLAVMMDDKTTFDMLWKFTKTYMQNQDGAQKDFFAWRLNGEAPYPVLDENPAPDGEEYFAMSLFFANNKWGSGDGIFDYQSEANAILNDMINTQTENTRLMMHPTFRQIEFTTTLFTDSFTDASYHLPAFYELWALWADDNNQYWHEVAQVSREFFARSGHPVTGLFSDYSTHEGAPKVTDFNPNSHKSAFDSHRVIGNIAMDYHWISQSDSMLGLIDKLINFHESEINTFGDFIAIYEVDGTREPGINFRGEGKNAMLGYGATASELPFSDAMLQSLWDQQLPTGEFRYYDGFLYMFSLLHASGEFVIHKPQ